MFSKICSYSNIEAAYLEIRKQFSTDRRNLRYHGIDNIFLRDINLTSHKIIKTIRDDFFSKKEIEAALLVKIPKKNKPGEFREIFVYNLKERIKAQAVYRVVQAEFEKVFSKHLFSYRPNKSPHLASRMFCRRYRKKYLKDQALIIDLRNYSDLIDRDIMMEKLESIFTDKDLLDIFRLFIFNKVYRDGVLETPSQGLVQGVPLIALFANLYLTEIDFKYQKMASFYVRVGDDIALLDEDASKLKKISQEMGSDIKALGLELNQGKLFLGPSKEEFSYLGYNFNQGLISLESAQVRRIELDWKKILLYKHFSKGSKRALIRKKMAQTKTNFNLQFKKIIEDKSQINNSEQIKELSESFFKIMTKFFYINYSERSRRLLEKDLAEFKIKSLYKHYKKFHYERNS